MFRTDTPSNDNEKLLENGAHAAEVGCSPENKEIEQDNQIGTTTTSVSNSPPKSTNEATLPIVSKPSFGSIEFGGPTKKYASTGTLFSFGTDHDEPAGLLASDLDAHQKKENLATSPTAEIVQTITKDVDTMSASGAIGDQKESGEIFPTIL